jgi:hypothetical protein
MEEIARLAVNMLSKLSMLWGKSGKIPPQISTGWIHLSIANTQ